MCARCGFDAPGRARTRWVGQCHHGIWEPDSEPSRGRDVSRGHWAESRCSMLDLEQCARLRCRRCAWEVPNFLGSASAPEAEPVPTSAQLAAGAVIVARARAAVSAELGFTCSAGIASNKLLAKLCGGLHKPNQQTLLPRGAVHALLDPLPIDRLRGFGGKLGAILREGRPDLGLPGYATAGELRSGGGAAAARLLRGEWSHPGEEAARAVRMASGCDDDAVRERPLAKQVGACKNFSGARRPA